MECPKGSTACRTPPAGRRASAASARPRSWRQRALGIDHAAALGRAGRIAVADVVVAGHEVARVGEEAGRSRRSRSMCSAVPKWISCTTPRGEAAELRLAKGPHRRVPWTAAQRDGADLALPSAESKVNSGATDRPSVPATARQREPPSQSFRLMANILSRSSRVSAPPAGRGGLAGAVWHGERCLDAGDSTG